MKADSFKQLSVDPAVIRNQETFRLACCDCHLVHDVTVNALGLPLGAPLRIKLRRNNRATNYRRKLRGEI
jgi:hypothetical protein